MPETIELSSSAEGLRRLVARARELRARAAPGRAVVGVVGVPGAGKSTFAQHLVGALGAEAVNVPMDGFHLADVELDRLGLRDRKGAPETFDAHGYAALLSRIRAWPDHIVYAPGFERESEQPLAGALPVMPEHHTVVTEGNYLLVDGPGWRSARECTDEVWFVSTDEEIRLRRLVGRHMRFGKSPEAARDWVRRVDEANARLIERGRDRADLLVDLSKWRR